MGESHLGPFSVQLFGDRPGDRVIVRDPEDQALFSREQSHEELLDFNAAPRVN